MMSDFIRARQENGSYCGPAVMQMLLSGIGLSVSQESVVQACGAERSVMKVGIPLTELAIGITKMFPELAVWEKRHSSIEDIKNLLELGYLVAFDWQGIFQGDEYHDDEHDGKLITWWKRLKGEPELKGDQGHYCIALEVNSEKGYLRFADPYGHYAGKDRYVALWEFEERWWDDRIDTDEKGKKVYVLEERLIFVVTKKRGWKTSWLGDGKG